MTGGHDPIFTGGGEKTGWMEHRKPEWMLVDLLGGGLCSCLGKGRGDFNLGDNGWRWHEVREVQEVFEREHAIDMEMGWMKR